MRRNADSTALSLNRAFTGVQAREHMAAVASERMEVTHDGQCLP